MELLQQSPKGQLPVSSVPELLIGFSDNQISQVMGNCDKIHSVADVKTYVEIWKEIHAHTIMGIISEVFEDVEEDLQNLVLDDFLDEDAEDSDEDWNDLLTDPDLMEMNWEDFSLSNIFPDDSSFLEGSKYLSSDFHSPELDDLIDKVQIE